MKPSNEVEPLHTKHKTQNTKHKTQNTKHKIKTILWFFILQSLCDVAINHLNHFFQSTPKVLVQK